VTGLIGSTPAKARADNESAAGSTVGAAGKECNRFRRPGDETAVHGALAFGDRERSRDQKVAARKA